MWFSVWLCSFRFQNGEKTLEKKKRIWYPSLNVSICSNYSGSGLSTPFTKMQITWWLLIVFVHTGKPLKKYQNVYNALLRCLCNPWNFLKEKKKCFSWSETEVKSLLEDCENDDVFLLDWLLRHMEWNC